MSKRQSTNSQDSLNEKGGYYYEDDASSSLAGDKEDNVPLLQSNNGQNTSASDAEYSIVYTIAPKVLCGKKWKEAKKFRYNFDYGLSSRRTDSRSGLLSMFQKHEETKSKPKEPSLKQNLIFTREKLCDREPYYSHATDADAMSCAVELFQASADNWMARHPNEKVLVEGSRKV